jgi:hypothetical protein
MLFHFVVPDIFKNKILKFCYGKPTTVILDFTKSFWRYHDRVSRILSSSSQQLQKPIPLYYSGFQKLFRKSKNSGFLAAFSQIRQMLDYLYINPWQH